LRVDVFVGGVLQPLTSARWYRERSGEAVANAVSDWAMYVGYALLGELEVKIGEEPQNVGPLLVYQGLVGIRGRTVLGQQRRIANSFSTCSSKGLSIPQVSSIRYCFTTTVGNKSTLCTLRKLSGNGRGAVGDGSNGSL
jgi:hypothetical protein